MPGGGLLHFPLLRAPHGSLLLASHCTLKAFGWFCVLLVCRFSHPVVALNVSHCYLQTMALNLELAACRRALRGFGCRTWLYSGAGCLQEKFELVRGLKEQQRLARVLADENQAMTDEFNRQVPPISAALSCLPAARETACCTPPLLFCRPPRYSRAALKSGAARSRLLPSTWRCRAWLPNGMHAATAPRRRPSRSR